MVRFSGGLLLFSAFRYGAVALPGRKPAAQNVLDIVDEGTTQGSARKLHGRFLHITDIHPDPFYKPGTDPSGSHPCHSGKGAAGYYGAEKTDCDSPLTLLDATFDWIKHNVADDIDFVIWTGDSARHDNDEKIPRTSKSIEAQNQLIVDKFIEVFAKSDHDDRTDGRFRIPIVPTFGNNDILPHNIFMPGPNRWTRKFLDIWDDFIPQQQQHSFARGGWFYTEVIPGRLAVVSLNTLYFFESNAAVDGCDNRGEPGYEHFEWLRVQLEFLRQRSMKAILIGHVPPARTSNKQNWDETCYQKYLLWLRQYRDVIVGNIYGHMNLDHFMLQDLKDLKYKGKIESVEAEDSETTTSAVPLTTVNSSETVIIQAKSDYLADLRSIWCDLPSPPKDIGYNFPDPAVEGDSITKNKKKKKKRKLDKYLKKIGGPYGERFSLSLVSPSVVPNFYPTLRVVEYNISGLHHAHPAIVSESSQLETFDWERHDNSSLTCEDDASNICDFSPADDVQEQRKRKKKKKHKKKPSFPVPHPPSDPTQPGPAYFPQTFTLLSFTQYYANVTKVNEKVDSDITLLRQRLRGTDADINPAVLKDLAKKHFEYEIEYSTNDDKQYRMQDLTVRRWLELAEQMGRDVWNIKDQDDSDENADKEDDDIAYERDEAIDQSGLEVEGKGKKRGLDAIKKNHLWRTFVKRAFVHAKLDDELDEEFG